MLTFPFGVKPDPSRVTVSPELWQLRVGAIVIVAAEALEAAARHAASVAARHSFM
jgi:hypothetical protein